MKKTYILALSLSLITCQLYAADSNTASPEPVITYNASVANSIDNIAEKLREFQDKNPNASEAELNEYADSLLKTEVVQNSGALIQSYNFFCIYRYGRIYKWLSKCSRTSTL